MQEADGTA